MKDPPVLPGVNTTTVLIDISTERDRQDRLQKAGKFPYTLATTDPLVTPEWKFAVLSEEVGEVAKHITEQLISKDRYDPSKLRKELIEVAACCVAWAESLPE